MKEDEDLSANIKEYLESSAFEVHNSNMLLMWQCDLILTATARG